MNYVLQCGDGSQFNIKLSHKFPKNAYTLDFGRFMSRFLYVHPGVV